MKLFGAYLLGIALCIGLAMWMVPAFLAGDLLLAAVCLVVIVFMPALIHAVFTG